MSPVAGADPNYDWKDCFNCGKLKERRWIWFCDRCTAAKEAGYAESRRRGETDWGAILSRREDILAEARKEEQ